MSQLVSNENSACQGQTPLVSIGIPTYNRPDGLRRALESVTRQAYRNLEIIVSDNASPGDLSENVVREFMAIDPRVRYFRQHANIGAIANFQFTLDQAQGKYFLWAADDDLCEPGFVDVLVSCMEKNEKIVLAMTDVKVIGEDDSLIRIEHLESIRQNQNRLQSPTIRSLFFRYPTSNIFFCIYGLYRTEALRTCALNFRSWRGLIFASEVPFLAQFAVRGEIVSIPGALKLYRSHAESAYVTEARGVSIVDKFVRGAQIRLQLANIAITSNLGLLAKLHLLASNFWSWIEAMFGLACILSSKFKNCVVQILRKRGGCR